MATGSKLLRGLGLFAYGLLLLFVFGLAAYTSFSLFVRSGVTTVPSVEGLSRAEAANRLADQGLSLRPVAEEGRFDEKVPAGHVLRQEPGSRTLVKRGSGVEIVLSKGPQRVPVPDVARKKFSAAQAALTGAGLAVGTPLTTFARGLEADMVLGQDPPPDVFVPPTTEVDLLLPKPIPDQQYIMPDLIYRQYEQIRPYFERQGFRLGNVKFERYEGVGAGVILRQFPLPGHPVSQEDSISLVVATAEGVT